MSRINPEEIIDLTCAVFGVPRADLLAKVKGKGNRMRDWPYFARMTAAMLIRRHTYARPHVILTALGRIRCAAGYRWLKNAESIAAEGRRYPPLGALIEAVERRIDDLHERRCASRQIDLENAIREQAP